jgi:hypothetical protein
MYDIRVREAKLESGDRVLVRNVGLKGKHKLADKWGRDVYIVAEQPNPDVPVFLVKKEHGRGNPRTVHRNLLYPSQVFLSKTQLNLMLLFLVPNQCTL